MCGKTTSPQNQTANTIINITINVNNNGSIVQEDMLKLVNDAVLKAIDKVLNENNGSLIVKAFDALHCNPAHPETHIAAIPNVNKDEMLVVNSDGGVDSMTKNAGALEIMNRMANDEIPKLARLLQDPLISKSAKLEALDPNSIETISHVVRQLENLPPSERRETVKNLRTRKAKPCPKEN